MFIRNITLTGIPFLGWGKITCKYVNCNLRALNKHQMMVVLINELKSNSYISRMFSTCDTVPIENK